MKIKLIVYSLLFFICLSGGAFFIFFKKPCIRLPISLGPESIPSTLVDIQGKKYPLEIDFGSKFQLTLTREILKGIEKIPYGNLQGRDAKGLVYESPAYIIPKIKIGDHVFEDVIVKEVNEAYVVNTTLYSENNVKSEILKNKYGVIGRALLEKMNLLIDFPNLVLIEYDDISELRKNGYSEDDLIKIPFEIGRTGPIITVDTDFGKARLSFDTGSTGSLIRYSFAKEVEYKNDSHGLHYVISSRFVIENKNFGNVNLYLYDISPELNEIDGVLGMDFLVKHVLYIDYRNKFIYIGEANSKTGKTT